MGSELKRILPVLAFLILSACDGDSSSRVPFPDGDDDGVADIIDVDVDNNGLIEIRHLVDLDNMRYDLAGASRASAGGSRTSLGCPARGCNGYELVVDLDFDSNGDGVLDAGDRVYDEEYGWKPVGNRDTPYTGSFSGNGFHIRNLVVRDKGLHGGLFGFVYLDGSERYFRDTRFDGPLASIQAQRYSGALFGDAYVFAGAKLEIDRIEVDLSVATTAEKPDPSSPIPSGLPAGGIVGRIEVTDAQLSFANSNAKGHVTAVESDVGGLAGSISANRSIVTFSGNKAESIIAADTFCGGAVGDFSVSRGTLHVASTEAVSTISCDRYVGGLFGKFFSSADDGVVENMQAYIDLHGNLDLGGFAGDAVISANISISDIHISGSISGVDVGDVTGYAGGVMGGLVLSAPSLLFRSMVVDVKFNALDPTGAVLGQIQVWPDYNAGLVIDQLLATGEMVAPGTLGGVVGDIYHAGNLSLEVRRSLVLGALRDGTPSGAVLGALRDYSESEPVLRIYDSFWATEVTGLLDMVGQGATMDATRSGSYTLAQLACPVVLPDEDNCVEGEALFQGWGDGALIGESHWEAGHGDELPALNIRVMADGVTSRAFFRPVFDADVGHFFVIRE